jgi:tetratricopeptide (TPR) repeat protein
MIYSMKKIFLLGLMLCATVVGAFGVGVGAPVWQDGGRADVYYRDGARFALDGRLTEAANAFERAAALDPTNGNTFYSLGNVYSELGRWADAVNAYYKAISLKKDDIEAYNNLGIALSRRGQNVQAAAAFERAIKIYPKWAEPYFHLSQVRHELRQEQAAQEAYNRALRLRPDYATQPPRTFMTAGMKTANAPGDRNPESAKAVNASSGLPANNNPRNVAAPPTLAPAVNVTSTTGDSATTTKSGNITSTKGSNLPSTKGSNIASTTSGDVTTARVDDVTTAKGENAGNASRPETLDARDYYDLGLRYGRENRHAEAVAAFRQAIFLDRNNAAAYLALGDIYAAQGSWRESVDAYEQAARLNPNDAEIYQRLGRSYAKLRETTPTPETSGGSAATNRDNATTLSQKLATPAPEDDPDPTAVYRVGPGDVLDIRVLNGRERRASTYEVTPTGLLAYPSLSEPLHVTGLTTEQVATRLGAELKLRAGGADPEIAVGVRDYVSHAIIVSGMVKDTGTKILQREGVPLYVIIAYAQPLPGAGQALVVSRATGRGTAIDLSDARAMKMLVRPGDVITVRTRPGQYVYLAGAVRQPGQREFHVGLTLTQALLAAGGTFASGASIVAVTRQGDDGRLTTTRYNLFDIKSGKTPDPLMQPGDRVEVLGERR